MREFKSGGRYLRFGLLLMVFLILSYGQLALGDKGSGADTPEAVFKEANSAYQEGDFNKAAQLYQQLCDEGYISGNLLYNLGNAYYKLGAKGRAVLNYERARRLIPGDADLKANLNYVLSGTQEGASDWKYDLLRFVTGLTSVEQLAIAGSVCFFGMILLLILGITRPNPLRNLIEGGFSQWWAGIIISCSIVFITVASLGLLTFWNQSREHAVAVKGVEVRFEPSPAATIYYQLAEGSRVQILEGKDQWVKIKRVDGKRGWIDRSCLETI